MFKADSSPRYHISEPLVVLVKLFNDDRTLDYIMQHAQVDLNTLSTVEFFVNLLLEFYTTVNDQTPLKQLTCTALVNILWSVSFQKQYQDELQGNQKFKAFIENIENAKVLDKIVTTQYVPKYIENIRTAAGGILLNINATMPTVKVEKEQQHRHPSSTTEAVRGARVPALVQRTDSNSRPMIMISYSHGDKDFCYQLHDGLKSKFDIWIDMNHRQTGDLWQKIAEGMDKSNVILCLVSETYCQSKSCRREVTYALDALDELEQPVIPLFLQQYKPPSWLKIRTSGLKYVRFRDIKQLESEKLSELVQMIEQNLSLPSSVDYDNNDSRSCAPSHYEPAAPPPTTTSTTTKEKTAEENKVKQETYIGISELYQKPVEQWNKNDVSQWFEYNEILVEIQDLYKFKDGSELLSYAPSLLADEKLQYQIYSKTFSKKNNGEDLLPHEYTKFVNALRKLYEKTIEKSKPVKVAVPADAKSQTCQIL
ncbi:unnamed protein product [Didymodactylos carnosus]|uniref:TIR domain-containing protein n=1 Tax=Didymodactylos carnosus TaxID=1234261 RepID=A0A814UV00_9BILA|nr:unnamed protein product [Didymodactylos carnosus]CAF1178224.1 unnamed protein product [Didymodactylos carnosus]CAF3772762.1 unnamed protein product [Didymodactylos carnosus]CAF3942423.1 unnamed protein product [Didymodactylos carnosus]